MKHSALTAFITILLLNSCVKSLHSLTDDPKYMVFKKELLGKWKDAKENTNYIVDTVPNTSGKTYAVTVIDHSNDKSFDTSNFTMILVNLAGNFFADCAPDIQDQKYAKVSDVNKSLLLTTHLFCKIFSMGKNLITISVIDNDEFTRLLGTNKIKMEYQKIKGDEILLLDNSKILRQKLIELEKFPSVYKTKNSLIRMGN